MKHEKEHHILSKIRINITCIRIMLSDISYSQAWVLLYHCLSLLYCIVDTHIDYLLTQPFLLEEMDFWNKHTPILNTWEDNIDWAMNNQKCFFCFSSVILARIMYRESSEASSEVSWSPYYYSVCQYLWANREGTSEHSTSRTFISRLPPLSVLLPFPINNEIQSTS